MPDHPLVFASDHQTSIDLVTDAAEICVVAPGLDEPRAHALAEAARRGADVHVVVDPAGTTERHGLGTLRAVQLLREAGTEVRQLPALAAGLLLVDRRGYLIFPQSRLFAEEGAGPNAVSIDVVLAERLRRTFVPPQSAEEVANAEARLGEAPEAWVNETVETSRQEPLLPVEDLDWEAFSDARNAIANNRLRPSSLPSDAPPSALH